MPGYTPACKRHELKTWGHITAATITELYFGVKYPFKQSDLDKEYKKVQQYKRN